MATRAGRAGGKRRRDTSYLNGLDYAVYKAVRARPVSERLAPFVDIVTSLPNRDTKLKQGDNDTSASSLRSYGIGPSLSSAYASCGVTALRDWQIDLLHSPAGSNALLHGTSFVFSSPTASGKTLVAELLILQRLRTYGTSGGKVLFIVPFVSLVLEKVAWLQRVIGRSGIGIAGFYNNIGISLDGIDIAVCTIERAYGIVMGMLATGASKGKAHPIKQLIGLVIDEIHMLGDDPRGLLLEQMLSSLHLWEVQHANNSTGSTSVSTMTSLPLNRSTTCQIIGMSATLPNLETLAAYIGGGSYVCTQRLVPLRESVIFGGIEFSKTDWFTPQRVFMRQTHGDRDMYSVPALVPITATFETPPPQPNSSSVNRKQATSSLTTPELESNMYAIITALVLEAVATKSSVLIFCSKRDTCQTLTRWLINALRELTTKANTTSTVTPITTNETVSSTIQEARDALVRRLLAAPVTLTEAVPLGLAFHHAGLSSALRTEIETSFRDGTLNVLAATTTLAAGVNLPARRVIFFGLTSFGNGLILKRVKNADENTNTVAVEESHTNATQRFISRTQYQQMAGRAGRSTSDAYGEVMIVISGGSNAKGKPVTIPVKSLPSTTVAVPNPSPSSTSIVPAIASSPICVASSLPAAVELNTAKATTFTSARSLLPVVVAQSLSLDTCVVASKTNTHHMRSRPFLRLANGTFVSEDALVTAARENVKHIIPTANALHTVIDVVQHLWYAPLAPLRSSMEAAIHKQLLSTSPSTQLCMSLWCPLHRVILEFICTGLLSELSLQPPCNQLEKAVASTFLGFQARETGEIPWRHMCRVFLQAIEMLAKNGFIICYLVHRQVRDEFYSTGDLNTTAWSDVSQPCTFPDLQAVLRALVNDETDEISPSESCAPDENQTASDVNAYTLQRSTIEEISHKITPSSPIILIEPSQLGRAAFEAGMTPAAALDVVTELQTLRNTGLCLDSRSACSLHAMYYLTPFHAVPERKNISDEQVVASSPSSVATQSFRSLPLPQDNDWYSALFKPASDGGLTHEGRTLAALGLSRDTPHMIRGDGSAPNKSRGSIRVDPRIQRLFHAVVLSRHVIGSSPAELLESRDVGGVGVSALVTAAAAHAGQVLTLCRVLHWEDLRLALSVTATLLDTRVPPELEPFMALAGGTVDRHRAKLLQRTFGTVFALATAQPDAVAALLLQRYQFERIVGRSDAHVAHISSATPTNPTTLTKGQNSSTGTASTTLLNWDERAMQQAVRLIADAAVSIVTSNPE